MKPNRTPISKILTLNPQFIRSVNLERDFYAKESPNGYIITRGVSSALSLLARGFAGASYRAQCISGPYGSGKSALALYFAKITSNTHEHDLKAKAIHVLGEAARQWLPHNEAGYLTIVVNGARQDIASVLLRALNQSLQNTGKEDLLRDMGDKYRCLIDDEDITPNQVVGIFEYLSKTIVDSRLGKGIVVIIDELGKLLEYAALHPEDSDIQILQELAEAASRSKNYPIWIITILHQQFSQYASRLGRRHQREWEKVQQRFYDVPLVLDSLDAWQLVANALNSPHNEEILRNSKIQQVADICSKLAPRGFEEDFKRLSVDCYPLHPTTLIVLPTLFKRFGQNERSLFSFLSADEPFSLTDWIRTKIISWQRPQFFRLPELFDYVYNTLIGGAPNPQVVRIWTEIEDCISRLGNASKDEIDVLKTISILNIVGDSSRLNASEEVLKLALKLSGYSEKKISAAIRKLVEKRLIVFRRFKNGYRLWEGSDVDIAERLAEAYQALPSHSNALTVARELYTQKPLIARKHSFRTGTLRLFEISPSSCEELQYAVQSQNGSDYDGRIVQCLVENDERFTLAHNTCKQIDNPSVILILANENDELAESARDVAALEWIRKNTAALSSDRVARQELNERRLEAEIAFTTEWTKIFGPNSDRCVYYWQGNEYHNLTSREFSSLLSKACDVTFPFAPTVNNELINRRHLSSAAAAARRKLIESMILSGSTSGLGITRYPPERSIYESMLLKSGIHREDDGGQWHFARPNDLDPGLQKAWDCILYTVSSTSLDPTPVSRIFEALCGPPYGVAEGFAPILLCACLLANSSTMALYENKTFVPYLSVPTMERLMRRPEDFSVVAYSVSGERSAIIGRFAEGFEVDYGVLPVVKSLYARMSSLPQYTKVTGSLPPKAIAVRDAIHRAKSPERLLFVDLPKALGLQPFFSTERQSLSNEKRVNLFFDELNKAFNALVKCYPDLVESIKRSILRIFDVPLDKTNWHEIVNRRASKLDTLVTDTKLRTLIIRAQDAQIDDMRFIESIAAGIAGQPPNQWSRIDEDNFARLVPQIASQIRTIEGMQDLDSSLEESEDGYIISISGKNGGELRQIVRFSAEDRYKIDKLVKELIGDREYKEDSKILLAAITEAANRIIRALKRKTKGQQENG